MSERLDKSMGSVTYDGIVVDNHPPADVFSVKVKEGQGVLKRGTVLARSMGTAGTGEMVVLGTTAAENETLSANCVLCDGVDTGTGDAIGALAYRQGRFARNLILVKEGYTLTETDEEHLRNGGIYLDDAINY